MKHLICPVCAHALQLTENGKSLQCGNRHLYDRARQGYFNLLLNQHKHSKHPGDSTDMIQARHAFLELNHYQSISDTLNRLVSELLSNSAPQIQSPSILDVGCGEGYYDQKMLESLTDSGRYKELTLTGLDISVAAVKAACRRPVQSRWLVASAAAMPVATDSQHLACNIFGQLDAKETARVLTEGGSLIVASTGANHLIELRQQLYETVKEEVYDPYPALQNDFKKTGQYECHDQFTLEGSANIFNLLKMTPHFWKSSQQAKQKLAQVDRLQLSIDVNFSIFETKR